MKVARSHIIAAIDNSNKITTFKKYVIKAVPYQGKSISIGEFGWTISVIPIRK